MTCVFFTTITLFLALLTLNMRSLEARSKPLEKPLEKPRRHRHHHHKDKEELDFRARVLDTLGELEVREGKIVPKEE